MTIGIPGSSGSARYRGYVLIVLMLVYVFNFLDRQILAILAEDIKSDLGIGDAMMGFLLGTSFAIFYAVFGIPLGRAADVLHRTRLIAAGLFVWSIMTSLSGLAQGFVSLALCRMGVGVGEASASPAAYSLLYDYYPKRVRTTALAIYSSGIFIGAGIGLFAGGAILTGWKHAFPNPETAPFGLRAWQAAFVLVGLPGVLLALWVATLREPVRADADGLFIPRDPHPWRTLGGEFAMVLPVLGLVSLARSGGLKEAGRNLALGASIGSAAVMLTRWLGGAGQWATLGYGAYAFTTWCQNLRCRDPQTFHDIFRCRPLVLGSLGFSGCFFLTAGALAWLAVFFQRVHGAPAAEVGLVLGLSYASMGFLGVTIGGILTDRVVARFGARSRLIVAAAAVTAATAAMAILIVIPTKDAAYLMTLPFNFFSAIYVAPGAANVNSLAPSRHRATASAAYIACQVFLGTALGPYVVGAISEALTTSGRAGPEALRAAMLISLFATLPAVCLLLAAARSRFPDDLLPE